MKAGRLSRSCWLRVTASARSKDGRRDGRLERNREYWRFPGYRAWSLHGRVAWGQVLQSRSRRRCYWIARPDPNDPNAAASLRRRDSTGEEAANRCLRLRCMRSPGVRSCNHAATVPIEHLGMVLGDGAGFAGSAMWGFGMGPQGPDYRAVGDIPPACVSCRGCRGTHVSLPGRHSRSCARVGCNLCTHGQLLQAPGPRAYLVSGSSTRAMSRIGKLGATSSSSNAVQ
jgi:hypothetical protein